MFKTHLGDLFVKKNNNNDSNMNNNPFSNKTFLDNRPFALADHVINVR